MPAPLPEVAGPCSFLLLGSHSAPVPEGPLSQQSRLLCTFRDGALVPVPGKPSLVPPGSSVLTWDMGKWVECGRQALEPDRLCHLRAG